MVIFTLIKGKYLISLAAILVLRHVPDVGVVYVFVHVSIYNTWDSVV